MNKIALLENQILEYAWGSRTFISSLTGKETPSANPQAEMWMGAHTKAPSILKIENNKIQLHKLISKHPVETLNSYVAEKFSKELPFLFKVLAASKPLSIQAHPDKIQAVEGFKRENLNKIPIDAPERNYRDKNHKPELICALSNMWLLKGFRHPSQIMELFGPFEKVLNKKVIHSIKEPDAVENLKGFLKILLYLDEGEKNNLLNEIKNISEKVIESNPAYKWVSRLKKEYPNDIGALSPLFLNLINMKPGEAIFLPEREFHAYLEGAGLEIMANSDNVLRGGLTNKHIDKSELFNVLDFTPSETEKIKPKRINFEQVFESSAEEFMLSRIHLPDTGSIYRSSESRSVEIILCTDGFAEISASVNNQLTLSKGMSAFIPASAGMYTIRGESTVFKATVP